MQFLVTILTLHEHLLENVVYFFFT